MQLVRYDMEKSKLGKIIDKYSLSQKDLADSVNVTPASVNRWCNITDGKHTQFEYKLIPDIINFFRSKGITDVHPNEILDLEQFGIERETLKIKGEIRHGDSSKGCMTGQVRLLEEEESYSPKFNLSGNFYLIRERKNINHLWYYIVDNSIQYQPQDNTLIDLPGIVFFSAHLNKQPIYIAKIGRDNDRLSCNSFIDSMIPEYYEMKDIRYVQSILGVEYSK